MIRFILPLLFFGGPIWAQVSLQKAKQFLTEKRPCRVAFSGLINSKTEVPSEIFCVWDGIFAEGTVNEAKGCFFGRYNLVNARVPYTPRERWGWAVMGRNQKKGSCNRDLVDEILFRAPSSDWNQFSRNSKPNMVALMKENNVDPYVLYDEYGILSSEQIEKARHWKGREKFKLNSKLKCPDRTKTVAVALSLEDEIQCASKEDLLRRYCSTNLGDKEAFLTRETYKIKWGGSMPRCVQPGGRDNSLRGLNY